MAGATPPSDSTRAVSTRFDGSSASSPKPRRASSTRRSCGAEIGKSRLVSQVTIEAVKRGVLALVSHGYQTEQTLAYGLWIDALRRGGVLDRDDVLSGVAVAWRAELARLFPELAQHDAPPGSSPEDATRLLEAVAHLIEGLAKAQPPLLLVLEDVHWADEAS